jgi:hypothetical protein
MKRILLLISCLTMVFLVHATRADGADKAKKFKDKQIEELSKKFFHYSTVDGKESLTLTSAPGKEWYEKAFGDSCENTIVRADGSTAIPNSPLILSFLACPASRDFEYDSIVAFFDRKNLNEPLCFSQLDVKASFYGRIQAVEAHKAGSGAYYAILTLGGAEGGDYWTSFLFLHLDMKCNITVLSRFHGQHGVHDYEERPGHEITYRFVDDKTVEVKTDHELDGKVLRTTREKYHLDELYSNPKSRVFPSKTERALALLENGADINSRVEDGKTLLMWAAEGRSPGIVQQFLDKGADVNARSKDGYTALMSAAYGGERTTVTMLLDKGADVNAKDDNGWTALMSAARTGHRNAAEVLLDRGADVNAKTKGDRTALKAAQEGGHADIVELLKARGAKE